MFSLAYDAKLAAFLGKSRVYMQEVVGERLTVMGAQQVYAGTKSGLRMYFRRPHSTNIEYLDTANEQIKEYMYNLVTKTYLLNPVVIITYDGRYSIRKVEDINE